MKYDNFLWHSEWNDALELYSRNDGQAAIDLYQAITSYGYDGTCAKFEDWQINAVFALIVAQIDQDRG